MTIHLESNVTWNVLVDKSVGIGYTNMDAFSFSGDIYKTYTLDAQFYDIRAFSPSAKPWELRGSFYVVA